MKLSLILSRYIGVQFARINMLRGTGEAYTTCAIPCDLHPSAVAFNKNMLV